MESVFGKQIAQKLMHLHDFDSLINIIYRGEGFNKRITRTCKESFKNSLVLLFRRRWDEANEKLFLKLSGTLLNGQQCPQ